MERSGRKGRAPDESGFERARAVQATGDARYDQREVPGAEGQHGVRKAGGAAMLQHGGEFPAVVDEFADRAQETAGAAGFVGGDTRI
jgi:hypothetical protein